MYQKYTKEPGIAHALYRKIWLIMRLTTVLLIASLMQLSAATFGQRITMNQQNVPLKNLFKEIRKQSGFNFFYDGKVITPDLKSSIQVSNASVEEALKTVLANLPLSYKIEDKLIIITKKPEPSIVENIIARFQTIDAKGKVVDSLGNGLGGATVSVKNGKASTSTSANGDFYLKNVDENDILIITYLGYVTKEISVNKEFNYVQLQQSTSKLDEIQIQAYGITSQRLSTGNISTVKAEDIAKAPVNNPLLAIAGRVPGVFIQQSSGINGSGIKVLIQGQNSISYGNDPFYVIDGVPFTSQLLPGLTNELGESGASQSLTGNTNGNPLNFINPQDIETISILKDADATSIYGSRAANGAIIITTKKGKIGKTSVNFNIQRGYGEIAKKLELLKTSEYLAMRKEAYINDNEDIPTSPTPGAYDLTYWNQDRYTDWQETLLGGTAKYINAMASISGGSANTQFLVNAGFQQQGSVTPGDLRDNKSSIHFSINNVSNDKRFRFSFSGSYVSDDNKLALVSSIASAAYTLPPNAPNLYLADGSLNWELLPSGINSFTNPMNALNTIYLNKTNNLLSNMNMEYEIFKGLSLKSSFGYNSLRSEEVFGNKINQLPAFRKTFVQRSSQFNDAEISSWIIEPQFKYNKYIGFGNIEALVGTTLQREDRDRQKLNASGFSSDQTLFNLKAASTIISPPLDPAIQSIYKYTALFGRVNYNLFDKYIINVSARKDGSTRFGNKNQFNTFASLAGAWIFSSENLMKRKLAWLSFGKLRMSYGTTGNDQIGDYAYLNLYRGVGSDIPYQGIATLEPSDNFPNPYLQWEETKKISASLDLGFLNDRILLNGTYFRNQSSNQLQFESLPSITGGYGVITNLPAKVQNTGVELSINTINIKRQNLQWSSSFNITIPRNKMFEYTGFNGTVGELNGKPLNVVKVYRFLGVDPETGLYIVADKNGSPTSTPDISQDQSVFIDTNPRFYGGFSNSVSFRGFSLDILLRFAKQVGTNAFLFGVNTPGLAFNQPTSILNRWQRVRDENAVIERFNINGTSTSLLPSKSDVAWSDASYLRLQNVSLSYNITNSYIEKLKIQSARVFVQGQNLFTLTNFKGIDPETRLSNGIPPLRLLTFGIQIGL